MANSYYLIRSLSSSTAQSVLSGLLAHGETGAVSAHRKFHYRSSADGKKFLVQGEISAECLDYLATNNAYTQKLGDYTDGVPESWVRTFANDYWSVDMTRLVPDNYGTCNYPYGSAMTLTEQQIRDQLTEVKDTGLGWMRTDFDWAHIEPSKGQFNWQYYDRLVTAANEVGIKLLPSLGYSVGWSNGSQGNRVPPTDMQDYADFAVAVVTRYFPLGVTHYEFWNEANWYKFWGPTPDANRYADLLAAAYPAVKTAVPGATILFSGMAPVGPSANSIAPQTFLQTVYNRGLNSYFDIMNHHPYDWFRPDGNSHTSADNMIAAIRQVMVNNGDSAKKMWFTELGRPTGGDINYSSEEVQADMIRRSLWESAKRDYIEKMFIYNFKDTRPANDTDDREHHFGIVRSDGSSKPAARAVRDATSSV